MGLGRNQSLFLDPSCSIEGKDLQKDEVDIVHIKNLGVYCFVVYVKNFLINENTKDINVVVCQKPNVNILYMDGGNGKLVQNVILEVEEQVYGSIPDVRADVNVDKIP